MWARHSWLAYVLGTLALLAASGAHAGGGRITFSGAIVVPTCAVQDEAAAQTGGDFSSAEAVPCGGRSQPASSVSSYGLSVRSLGASETAGIPLLQYYADYFSALHAGSARIVTRTYQ